MARAVTSGPIAEAQAGTRTGGSLLLLGLAVQERLPAAAIPDHSRFGYESARTSAASAAGAASTRVSVSGTLCRCAR